MAAKKQTKKKEESTSAVDKLKSFFGSVIENVKEGASIVTEKIKDNSAKAYVAGAELVEEANDKIHVYTDKITLQSNLKKLEARQVEISNEFGAITLEHYAEIGTLHKAFLSKKAIEDLVNEYKFNQKDIISITKKIKKLNN